MVDRQIQSQLEVLAEICILTEKLEIEFGCAADGQLTF